MKIANKITCGLKKCVLCDSSPREYVFLDINLGPYYYCSNKFCRNWPISNTDYTGWLILNNEKNTQGKL